MRLSLKLPFALILLVALVFFSLSMVNARYEKLEKLLVIFVASEKIDLVKDLSGDRRYFLAKGIPGDLDWFDSEFAQANGLTEVVSGSTMESTIGRHTDIVVKGLDLGSRTEDGRVFKMGLIFS